MPIVSSVIECNYDPGFESVSTPWVFYADGSGTFLNDAPGAGSLHSGHVTILSKEQIFSFIRRV